MAGFLDIFGPHGGQFFCRFLFFLFCFSSLQTDLGLSIGFSRSSTQFFGFERLSDSSGRRSWLYFSTFLVRTVVGFWSNCVFSDFDTDLVPPESLFIRTAHVMLSKALVTVRDPGMPTFSDISGPGCRLCSCGPHVRQILVG